MEHFYFMQRRFTATVDKDIEMTLHLE